MDSQTLGDVIIHGEGGREGGSEGKGGKRERRRREEGRRYSLVQVMSE